MGWTGEKRKRARRGATGTTERRSGTRDSKVGRGFGRVKRAAKTRGTGGEHNAEWRTQKGEGGGGKTGPGGGEGGGRAEERARNPEVIKELLAAT